MRLQSSYPAHPSPSWRSLQSGHKGLGERQFGKPHLFVPVPDVTDGHDDTAQAAGARLERHSPSSLTSCDEREEYEVLPKEPRADDDVDRENRFQVGDCLLFLHGFS